MSLTESNTQPMGWPAPPINLPDTQGNQVSLDDFKDKKALLVVFTCNHCPYAKAAWPLLKDLHQQFGNDIGFVAINSNDADNYPDDSYEAMKQEVEHLGIRFPYVYDESQDVAKAYQAVCTPDPFLFKVEDNKFKLFYHGRINDNWQDPHSVTEKNLEDAMSALIEGKSPPQNQPASMGCSIKWK